MGFKGAGGGSKRSYNSFKMLKARTTPLCCNNMYGSKK